MRTQINFFSSWGDFRIERSGPAWSVFDREGNAVLEANKLGDRLSDSEIASLAVHVLAARDSGIEVGREIAKDEFRRFIGAAPAETGGKR